MVLTTGPSLGDNTSYANSAFSYEECNSVDENKMSETGESELKIVLL